MELNQRFEYHHCLLARIIATQELVQGYEQRGFKEEAEAQRQHLAFWKSRLLQSKQ